jgi:hypothetical protein
VLIYQVGDLYGQNERQVTYRRDKFGLRGDYGGDPSKIDILTLGGSTTDERYIGEGETWPDVLESDLASEQKLVRVANAGIDGQTTLGHIRDFDWWFPAVPGLRPKYYVFYVGINDFYNEDDNSELNNSGIRSLIKQKSALYYLYRMVWGLYRVKRAGLGHRPLDLSAIEWVEQPVQNNHAKLMGDGLTAYAERIRILSERVRQLGGIPIFVTQTTRRYKVEQGKVLGSKETSQYGSTRVNGVDCFFMMQLLNQKTFDTCRETGSVCIDLASELKFEDEDFYDYYHNTPQGAAKIGHYLYRKLNPIL